MVVVTQLSVATENPLRQHFSPTASALSALDGSRRSVRGTLAGAVETEALDTFELTGRAGQKAATVILPS